MALDFAAVGLCLTMAVPTPEPIGPPEPPTLLVRRLGDDFFAEREWASRQFRRHGRAAVAALRRGVSDEDAEIRRRCEELLPLASRTDLDIELDNFVAGAMPKTPLVGWERFAKLAGDDGVARAVFIELYRQERDLLATVEKDPKKVGEQLSARCRHWEGAIGRVGGDQRSMSRANLVALLYLAAVTPPGSRPSYYPLYNLMYLPGVAAEVRDCPVCRRLLTGLLGRKTDNVRELQQTAYLTQQLGLTELEETTVKPAVVRLAKAAPDRADDFHRLNQIINIAQLLDMKDVLDAHLKPAVRKCAAEAIRKPAANLLSQICVTAANLEMNDLIKDTLEPAVRKYLDARLKELAGSVVADPEPPRQTGRARFDGLEEIFQLAQSLPMPDVLEGKIKPAAYLRIEALLSKKTDRASLQQAIHLTQWFDLTEAFEDLVRPAAAQFIADSCAQPTGDKFREAISLAQQFSLREMTDEYLRPALRKLAREAAARPDDVARLHQVFQDLRGLQLSDDMNEVLKPAVAQLLKKVQDRPVEAGSAGRLLEMAEWMSLKEVADYAVRVALTKTVDVHTRGQALACVGEFGDREKALRLEPLLADKGSLGTVGINNITIQTQVRDVALAAMLTAHHEHPAEYGYVYPALLGQALNSSSYSCFGFADETERNKAREKWKKWLDGQRK